MAGSREERTEWLNKSKQNESSKQTGSIRTKKKKQTNKQKTQPTKEMNRRTNKGESSHGHPKDDSHGNAIA